MESSLTQQQWNEIESRSNPHEFGWIGVDRLSRIGYFSTFGQAYIPSKAMLSYKRYLEIAEIINGLPEISLSQLFIDEKGWFLTWHFHSRRGLFGFDYLDVHRNDEDKLDRYDLITVPSTPLRYTSLTELLRYEQMIPRFNLEFSDNISFGDLKRFEVS